MSRVGGHGMEGPMAHRHGFTLIELHGPELGAPFGSQFDHPGGAYDPAPCNRNATLVDGHVAHLTGCSGKLKDQ